jgi:pimeloyl-ACP methyl ester carboxylesterase
LYRRGDEEVEVIPLVVGSAVSLGLGLFAWTAYATRRATAPYPPAGRFVTVDGTRLHYLERGGGQPVVFLHGGMLDAHDFLPAIETVADAGMRGIAFDRPGYGHSQRPAEPVTPVEQARLIAAALRELDVDRPILVAHSYSGVIALAYALHHPDRLAGLVLVSAATYGGEAYDGHDDPISRLATLPVLGTLLRHTVLTPLGALAVPRMVAATFSPDPVPDGYLARATALWPRPAQFLANRRDVLAFSPSAQALSPRYREVTVPTVIVYGERDPFRVPEHARRLVREIPDAQLLVIPDAGHMLPQVRPAVVLDAIRRLPRRPAGASATARPRTPRR